MIDPRVKVGVVCLAAGMVLGRFSLPSKITQTSTSTKIGITDTLQDTSKTDHTVTTIVETAATKDKPAMKTTTIRNDVDLRIDRENQSATADTLQTSKTVEYDNRRTSLAFLFGTEPFNPKAGVSYGGILQYRLLGPITTGILGTSQGLLGVTVGVTF